MEQLKWNESGFRPPLCTYRLNWARRTSWGWWDDWDDTVLQTQDSKFEPWRSEAEHATSRSRRLPTILTFTRGWGRNNCVSFKPPRPGTEPRTLAWKAAVLTTTLGPPPNGALFSSLFYSMEQLNRTGTEKVPRKKGDPRHRIINVSRWRWQYVWWQHDAVWLGSMHPRDPRTRSMCQPNDGLMSGRRHRRWSSINSVAVHVSWARWEAKSPGGKFHPSPRSLNTAHYRRDSSRSPEDRRRWPNDGSPLRRRLRRRPNGEPSLGRRIVSAQHKDRARHRAPSSHTPIW